MSEAKKPGDEVRPGSAQSGENLCQHCGGTGRRGDEKCAECEGTGRVTTLVGDA